jgi:hypothetical protein
LAKKTKPGQGTGRKRETDFRQICKKVYFLATQNPLPVCAKIIKKQEKDIENCRFF